MYTLVKVILVLTTFLLSGCLEPLLKDPLFGQKDDNYIRATETYHVFVDSINDGENHNRKKYTLLPGLKNVKASNLQYKEYSTYVKRALKNAGYQQAQTGEEADIGIIFAYGIGEPQKETSYTTASYAAAIPSYYNYSAISTSSTKAHTTTSYTRSLILDAYDYTHFRQTGKEKQVWITKSVSTGARGDLREVLPIMVTAINPYIGKNTNRQLKLIVKSPSKELYKILGSPIPVKK